jgi:hypothetical protein
MGVHVYEPRRHYKPGCVEGLRGAPRSQLSHSRDAITGYGDIRTPPLRPGSVYDGPVDDEQVSAMFNASHHCLTSVWAPALEAAPSIYLTVGWFSYPIPSLGSRIAGWRGV